MEQEIRNADLSDMMCDLLYLLGCGVNEKMPAKAYIRSGTGRDFFLYG